MQNRLIFDSIPNRVKKNKFLLGDSFTTKDFSGSDTKELFEENLKKQPADWYYRTAPLTYTVNSLGYRTDEFKKLDWANSVVVFGCSNVFGIGVTDTETMPYQLSQILGMPVINMGVGGSSMTYSLHNSVILRDGYPTPKAVVQIWTGYDRTVYYNKKSLEACGSWNFDRNSYMQAWSQDPIHSQTHALFISKTSKWLWRDTKYFEGSYFGDTADLLGCYLAPIKDHGRDLLHPGKKTHYNAALKIAKELNL